MRVIHLEDNAYKAIDIRKALLSIGDFEIDRASNVEDGIEKIENASAKGMPYDLVITDMHFPMAKGEAGDWKAGEKLIALLKEKGIELPIILCSSMNISLNGAIGCVWYSELNDWEAEFRRIIAKIKK